MYEEIMIRQKRAELEGFAERRRLLKEARPERHLGFRQRLAVTLLAIARRLEPDLVQPREANC
jgi:hypothetical protein